MTLPRHGFPRRLQHRLDLHRMVSVVVEDVNAVPFADGREASLDAAEARKPLADVVGRDAELVRDGDRGSGVGHVVAPRHRQPQSIDRGRRAGLAVADHHVEQRDRAIRAHIGEAHVGLRVLAIGDDAAVLDAAHQRLHFGMVDAHHAEAVERHVLDEVAECLAHAIEGAVMVEVLRVDIGDHGDLGRQLQERAVAFVGLHDHPFALAHARIGAVGVDDAAIDDGRVEPARLEQGGDHRGGGRLAVGAGDGDGLAEAHQLGQHLGAPHGRQQPLARRDQFGIVLLDRGGNDHHLGIAEILGAVADEALDALGAQPLDIGVRRPGRSPARGSRDCAAPRRCRSCRCRRCRRNARRRLSAASS